MFAPIVHLTIKLSTTKTPKPTGTTSREVKPVSL